MKSDPKLNKALKYLEDVGFKNDIIDMMVKMHYNMIPQAPIVAWTELFAGLDYSLLIEGHAKRLANRFNEEELDELVNFAKSPVFQKLIHPSSDDDLEAEEESNEWFLKIEEDILSRARYVFTKHHVDMGVYDLMIRSILDLKGE